MTHPYIDYSDEIALVQARLQILTDTAPDGEWQTHWLVKKWQARNYSITAKELRSLLKFLETECRSATAQKYDQINLFGGVDAS